MGYYLQTPGRVHGKAQALLNRFGGVAIQTPPASLADVKLDQAVVCVVDNGPFEAAAVAYDDRELAEFSRPDKRPMVWLLLNDRSSVYVAAGVPDKP